MKMFNEQTFNSKPLVIDAPAKVNLHLEVLGLRNDGFHELAMVMQSISLCDQLYITTNPDGVVKLISDHPSLAIDNDNLIIKAANLLIKDSNNQYLSANIKLIKNIPIGAGLAGGSSDAAAALVGLNKFWELGYSLNQLEKISEELGSDVPFCVRGGRQFCFGRGDKLEKVNIQTRTYGLILVKDPLVEVSTPWAYKLYKDIFRNKYLSGENSFEKRRRLLRDLPGLSVFTSDKHPLLLNDLQKVVAPVTPSVTKALSIFESIPSCINSSMSGSGPSCFGLFEDNDEAKSVIRDYGHKFKDAGFDVWTCSMKRKGVTIKND